MEMPGRNIVLGILFLTAYIFGSACDKQSIQESGLLKGVITIGPICPVETDPPDPDCLPSSETYKAYPVSIWTCDSNVKIAQITPALDGSFTVELNTGNYLVKLEKDPIGIGSSNLPKEIYIRAQTTTLLNIEIDTGIR